jgi:hypothetical protein
LLYYTFGKNEAKEFPLLKNWRSIYVRTNLNQPKNNPALGTSEQFFGRFASLGVTIYSSDVPSVVGVVSEELVSRAALRSINQLFGRPENLYSSSFD